MLRTRADEAVSLQEPWKGVFFFFVLRHTDHVSQPILSTNRPGAFAGSAQRSFFCQRVRHDAWRVQVVAWAHKKTSATSSEHVRGGHTVSTVRRLPSGLMPSRQLPRRCNGPRWKRCKRPWKRDCPRRRPSFTVRSTVVGTVLWRDGPLESVLWSRSWLKHQRSEKLVHQRSEKGPLGRSRRSPNGRLRRSLSNPPPRRVL